jgi:hypothetical protein
MNEDGTTTTPEAPADAGESTTPEEVSQVLGLNAPETVTADEVETETEEETPENPEAPETTTPETEEEAPEVETTATTTETSTPEVPTFSMEIEDANGEKFTITELGDLPEDFEPKNNRQIMEILDGLRDLKSQKESYETDKATKAAEAEKQQNIASIQASWEAEIKELQGSKRLTVATDPKNQEDKANQRISAVFNFMAEENEKRQEAGRPMLQSFEDALDKLENREAKEAAVEKAKRDKELAKQRGGMVGGSSAPATNGSPAYRTGQARNASEAIRSLGLL